MKKKEKELNEQINLFHLTLEFGSKIIAKSTSVAHSMECINKIKIEDNKREDMKDGGGDEIKSPKGFLSFRNVFP